MTFLPIVTRELRLKARRPRTYYDRCAIAAVATVLCLGIVTIRLGTGGNPAQIGQDLYWAFSSVAFGFCLLAGPVLAADCVSEEKREGTIGLLFLTDLNGHDVVLGKWVAASLPPFYALLASIPILGLSFFLGGVTQGEFWRMTAVLLTTLFLSLSACLFVSTMSRDSRRAFVAAGALVFMLTLAPLLAAIDALGSKGGTGPGLPVLPSAGSLWFGVTDIRYLADAEAFWRSLFVLLLLGVLFLALAGAALPHCWQERPPAQERLRRLPGWRFRARMTRTRTAKRRRALDTSPALWLAERTTLNASATRLFWGVSLAVWACGYAALRERVLSESAVYGAVYVLHAAVKCWVAWEASRRLSEDKSSGALELLLTTPLSERTILAGWLMGLKRRLQWPVAAILALDAHLWKNGESGEWMLVVLAATGLFVADTYTLCWAGLWLGLNARNSTQAFVLTMGRVLVLPWFAFLALAAIWIALTQDTPFLSEPGTLVVAWFLGSYALDVGFCAWAIHKLSGDFRLAAARGYGPVRPAFRFAF